MAKTKNLYRIPVKKKDLGLAISGPNAHNGFLQYAIDFLVPMGTEIVAACDGKVIDVKMDSNEGGLDKKYLGNKYLNFITIEHEYKECSQYAHLKYRGACVKKGQTVKAGEVIGFSGNTGFTSAPHLHFHVCIGNDSEIGWETLEVQFSAQIKVIRNAPDLSEDDKRLLQEMPR